MKTICSALAHRESVDNNVRSLFFDRRLFQQPWLSPPATVLRLLGSWFFVLFVCLAAWWFWRICCDPGLFEYFFQGWPLVGVILQQSWNEVLGSFCYKVTECEFNQQYSFVGLLVCAYLKSRLKIHSKEVQGSRDPPCHSAFGLQSSQGASGPGCQSRWCCWWMGHVQPTPNLPLKLSSWSKEQMLWLKVSLHNSLWLKVRQHLPILWYKEQFSAHQIWIVFEVLYRQL